MNDPTFAPASEYAPEYTLGGVFCLLWRARHTLFWGALAGGVAGLIFLLCCVPQYRITMLLAPAGQNMWSVGTELAATVPGDVLQNSADPAQTRDPGAFARLESVLRGPSVAADLMPDKNLTHALSRNGRFIFSATDKISSAQAVAAILGRQVTIEPVGETRLRRVSFDTHNPVFGIALLKNLYKGADALIRKNAARRAADRSAYLAKALHETDDPDQRRAMATLLQKQQQLHLLLGADLPYAAIMVEPPAASARPVWPYRGLMVLTFVFMGALIGFCLFPPRIPQ